MMSQIILLKHSVATCTAYSNILDIPMCYSDQVPYYSSTFIRKKLSKERTSRTLPSASALGSKSVAMRALAKNVKMYILHLY